MLLLMLHCFYLLRMSDRRLKSHSPLSSRIAKPLLQASGAAGSDSRPSDRLSTYRRHYQLGYLALSRYDIGSVIRQASAERLIGHIGCRDLQRSLNDHISHEQAYDYRQLEATYRLSVAACIFAVSVS